MAKLKYSDPLLAGLEFEKKNKPLPRLPPNTTVQRRPLNHPPIAAPYAGASVQKVVYVSSRTPVMAAVKRVKKLLSHIEKRAMQDVHISNGKNGMKKLAEASEALGKNGESVVVKASGRAIEQAMKVGEWFKSKEDEVTCKVEVRTGSVQVVDDIVEVEVDEKEAVVEDAESSQTREDGPEPSTEEPLATSTVPEEGTNQAGLEEDGLKKDTGQEGKRKRKRGKKKRLMYDIEDMPEARVRWINTVEVAISLKG